MISLSTWVGYDCVRDDVRGDDDDDDDDDDDVVAPGWQYAVITGGAGAYGGLDGVAKISKVMPFAAMGAQLLYTAPSHSLYTTM
jgi:hypothetical protein